MAITSTEIEKQSFLIDRKGYNVDEVDVFLEHVSTEVDGMNARIVELQELLDKATTRAERAESKLQALSAEEKKPAAAPAVAEAPAASEAIAFDLREKDRRIAELEKELDNRKADANAISQALIIAQRSGDEIIANAKKAALNTQKDAEEEAKRILDKANTEKQRVMAHIADLQNDRELVRAGYQDMLRNFISDASKKLTEIGGDVPRTISFSSESGTGTTPRVEGSAPVSPAAPDPLESFAATYTTPRSGANNVTPAAPKPSTSQKDLSGFGEADDDFGFDDLD